MSVKQWAEKTAVAAMERINPIDRQLMWGRGLDLAAARGFGSPLALKWSSLRLSGAAGAGLSEVTSRLVERAIDCGLGVAWVGLRVEEGPIARARAAGREAVAFGPGRAGESHDRLSCPWELAHALDAGALACDAWGWGAMFSPRESPLGWERARAQMGLIGQACGLAKKPFLLALTLDGLERAMAPELGELIKAARERAPAGSRVAVALPQYGEPEEEDLCFGERAWFDASWIGRLDTSYDGGLAGSEARVKRLRSELDLAEASGLNQIEGRGQLRDLMEGEGHWLAQGRWRGPFNFPYKPRAGGATAGGARLQCARGLKAGAERERLADWIMGCPEGEADERGRNARRL